MFCEQILLHNFRYKISDIKDMKPVWQMEINFTLKDTKGKESEGKIHSTIHNVGSQ